MVNHMRNQSLFFAATLLMVGCVSGPKTQSGRPEYSAHGWTPAQVKATLVTNLSSAGWMIESSDDVGVSASKPHSTSEAILIGQGTARVRFNLVDRGASTFVTATMRMGNGIDVSDARAGADIQRMLEQTFPARSTSQSTSQKPIDVPPPPDIGK